MQHYAHVLYCIENDRLDDGEIWEMLRNVLKDIGVKEYFDSVALKKLREKGARNEYESSTCIKTSINNKL